MARSWMAASSFTCWWRMPCIRGPVGRLIPSPWTRSFLRRRAGDQDLRRRIAPRGRRLRAASVDARRSLFEGMAIAHWAHANPERAVELFKKHGRHNELLWGDAFEKADPDDSRTIPRRCGSPRRAGLLLMELAGRLSNS